MTAFRPGDVVVSVFAHLASVKYQSGTVIRSGDLGTLVAWHPTPWTDSWGPATRPATDTILTCFLKKVRP